MNNYIINVLIYNYLTGFERVSMFCSRIDSTRTVKLYGLKTLNVNIKAESILSNHKVFYSILNVKQYKPINTEKYFKLRKILA